MTSQELTPATVFMGFLGSGKTTLILHLVDELIADGKKVVYIKNEVGSAEVDSQLLANKKIQTRELLNGCICCTLIGSMQQAITQLIAEYHPDRILIESAGTADPVSMALAVSQHPQLRRDGVISIIDVVNFEGYEDLNPVARHQAEMTDLIVFNKIELVDDARKQAVVGYVRELNEYSPIVEAPHGYLNKELAFGLHTKRLEDAITESTGEQHHHLEEDMIETFVVPLSPSVAQTALQKALLDLPKNVLRVKGMVKLSDHTFVFVNGVYKRIDFWPISTQQQFPSQLLVVGYQVKQNQDEITKIIQRALVSDVNL